jgi:uncharacterized protein with HEPN domain
MTPPRSSQDYLQDIVNYADDAMNFVVGMDFVALLDEGMNVYRSLV